MTADPRTADIPATKPLLTPIYAINDPTGGDTWDSLDDALTEINTWGEGARREALNAGFIVRWHTPWLPVPEHDTEHGPELPTKTPIGEPR